MDSALIVILCVVFVIVLVVACVYFLVPSIRNRDKGKKETVQEIAEKEVNNMIVTNVKQQIGDPKKDSIFLRKASTQQYFGKIAIRTKMSTERNMNI